MQHTNNNYKVLLNAVANTIREERQKQGKSVRMLAYEYDLQISLLSRLENAKNDIKLSSLWSVCEALEIPPNEFLSKVLSKLPKDFSLLDI